MVGPYEIIFGVRNEQVDDTLIQLTYIMLNARLATHKFLSANTFNPTSYIHKVKEYFYRQSDLLIVSKGSGCH